MSRFESVSKPLMLSMALLLVALASGCKGGAGGGDPILGSAGNATLAPQVTVVAPANGATNVAVNTALTATFNQAVAPISGGASFTVTCAAPGTNPTGMVALDATSTTATFTPSAALAPFTLYTATVSGAKSLSTGLSMVSPYVWTFTTGATPDTTRPRVSVTVPATTLPGPTLGVPMNTAISAAFTEDMAAGTINATSFTVAGPSSTAVAGAVTYASKTAVFTPAAALVANTTYTATITTVATDLAGNQLAGNLAALPAASNYVWTFTTGLTPDTIRPQVTLTNPATTIPGPRTGVPTNTAIAAAFTEDMNPTTFTAVTFTVTGPGTTPVLGVVTYASRTAVFTPAAILATDTVYTATVTQAVTDLAGNQLAGNQAALPAASNYVWTFRTALAPDTTRPRVTLTVPATTIPGPTTGVAINTAIMAAFTEPMNPLTITAASFTLTGPGLTIVAGGVTYASQTAIFTPAAVLASATTYTATITTVATDLAGNQLAGNQAPLPAASSYVWTFTTSAAPDTTRPRVTLTVPATTMPGPTLNVAPNTAITAAFTEAMAPATINAISFTLTGPGTTIVAGSVSYVAQSAVFTPLAVLAASTTYTATITMAATDLAGNALAGNQASLPAASDYVWTFTTGAAPDTTSPTIILENPADMAINVALNSVVNATFSEPMDLSAATFTLQVSGPPLGAILAGTITYDSMTHIVTFTPPGNLLPSTSYTATIQGAKDLAGNPLVAGLVPNPWTFTTGTGLAPGAVNLGSASAFGIMATSAITNTGLTIINGDVSLDPGTSMTGFPPGVVNGTIHVNDTVSAQARADLLIAYNFAKTLPPGTTISAGADLGALYPSGIPPGTYTSGSTMLVSTPLTLDAGGNANAVWVFQNGAQAKNVFWVPTSDATIGVGTIFYGTIVSGRNVSGVTGATINGRILAGAITAGTIALDTNTVNVPAP